MSGWSGREIDRLSAIASTGAAIAPLHDPIRPPRKGGWLWEYNEPGQAFQEYGEGEPFLPTCDPTMLYVQPLGDFEPVHAAAIRATADLLEHSYSVPVRMLDGMDPSNVPQWPRRRNPVAGQEQVFTRFVLDLVHYYSRPGFHDVRLSGSDEISASPPTPNNLRENEWHACGQSAPTISPHDRADDDTARSDTRR